MFRIITLIVMLHFIRATEDYATRLVATINWLPFSSQNWVFFAGLFSHLLITWPHINLFFLWNTFCFFFYCAYPVRIAGWKFIGSLIFIQLMAIDCCRNFHAVSNFAHFNFGLELFLLQVSVDMPVLGLIFWIRKRCQRFRSWSPNYESNFNQIARVCLSGTQKIITTDEMSDRLKFSRFLCLLTTKNMMWNDKCVEENDDFPSRVFLLHSTIRSVKIQLLSAAKYGCQWLCQPIDFTIEYIEIAHSFRWHSTFGFIIARRCRFKIENLSIWIKTSKTSVSHS